MKDASLDVIRGTLDVLILKTLSWGPLHGYAVSQWIRQQTEEVLLVEEGALYPALYRMEAKGWLVRSPDPDDGRYTVATLTDAGYDAVAAAARGHVQTVRELVMDPLSRAQVQQLGTITGRILGAITADPLPGPAR